MEVVLSEVDQLEVERLEADQLEVERLEEAVRRNQRQLWQEALVEDTAVKRLNQFLKSSSRRKEAMQKNDTK